MTAGQSPKPSFLARIEQIRWALLPAALGLIGVAGLASVSLKLPIDERPGSCVLVRWTEKQANSSAPKKIAVCDMKDGQTITATASPDWTPPAAGSTIQLRISHLVFGTHYRVDEQS
jgi:hypothetical protein